MPHHEHRKLITIITKLVAVIIATPLTLYYLNGSKEPLPVISVTYGNETYHLTGDFVNNSTYTSVIFTFLTNESTTTSISETDGTNSSLSIILNIAAGWYNRAEGPSLDVGANITVLGDLSANLKPTGLELNINSSGPDANYSWMDSVTWIPERKLTNLSDDFKDPGNYVGYSSLTEKWNLLNESSSQKANQGDRYHFESWASLMGAEIHSPMVPNEPFYFHFRTTLTGLEKPVYTDLYLAVLNN